MNEVGLQWCKFKDVPLMSLGGRTTPAGGWLTSRVSVWSAGGAMMGWVVVEARVQMANTPATAPRTFANFGLSGLNGSLCPFMGTPPPPSSPLSIHVSSLPVAKHYVEATVAYPSFRW